MGPAGEVSDELVDEMLLRRAEARRARDYSTADAIKAELSERYQVGAYTPSEPKGGVDLSIEWSGEC